MTSFFGSDGKFHRFGTILADIMLIGIIWIIFSVPLVTIGATTTALYYVCTKKCSGKDEYIVRGFLKSFKENFFKSTVVFLLLVLVLVMALINLWILAQIEMGWLTLPTYISLYFVIMQVVFITTHVFCIISRFETTIVGAFKSAFFMAHRHLLTTIINIALLLTIIYVAMSLTFLMLFIMGIYLYLSSILFVNIFRKHYPDFDKLESARL